MYTQIAIFVYTQIAGVEFCVYTDCILVYKVGSGLEGGWVLRSSQAGESGSCVSWSSNAGCGSVGWWGGWLWWAHGSGCLDRGVVPPGSYHTPWSCGRSWSTQIDNTGLVWSGLVW